MPRGRAPGPGRLYQRDGGRTWYLDYRDSAGRRQIVALSTDRRTAEQIRARIISQRDMIRMGLHDIAGQMMLVSEVIELYLQSLKLRATQSYVYQAERILRRFTTKVGSMLMRDLRPAALMAVQAEAIARGSGNRTANWNVTTISSAFNWAVKAGIIAVNPLARVALLPHSAEYQRRRRRALTEDEVTRLLAAIDADDVEMARRLMAQRAMVRVPQRVHYQAMIETGARWSELRLLRWGDLDLAARLLTLRPETTKSKKYRVIPIRAEFAEELRALKVMHERVLRRLPTTSDHIFLSAYGRPWHKVTCNALNKLHKYLLRAGIKRYDGEGRGLDIHCMRHTAASRMARAGVSITFAQRLLGHADPRLTEAIYTHLSPEDLRAAVEVAGAPRPGARAVGG